MNALVVCEKSGCWSSRLEREGVDVVQVDLGLAPGVRRLSRRRWEAGADASALLRRSAGWDIVVAFPPCTDLSAAGAHLWPVKNCYGGLSFLSLCAAAAAGARVGGLVENPTGLAKRVLGDPSMIVNPWEFDLDGSEPMLKRTCLWLYRWPMPFVRWAGGGGESFIDCMSPSEDRGQLRSRPWHGMADAFVSQLLKSDAARRASLVRRSTVEVSNDVAFRASGDGRSSSFGSVGSVVGLFD